jgi:hypothetical protein
VANHRVGVDPRRAFTGQTLDVLTLDLDGAVARLLGLLQRLDHIPGALLLSSPLSGHGASVHSDRALTRQKRSLGTVHLDRALSGPLVAAVHTFACQLGLLLEAALAQALEGPLPFGLLLALLRGLKRLLKGLSGNLSKVERRHNDLLLVLSECSPAEGNLLPRRAQLAERRATPA